MRTATKNMKAYETYLRGLYFFNHFGNDESMGKAIPYFEKAIEMQPDFGLPHSRLGLCYLFQAWGMKITWEEAHRKATYHIERTKELGIETAEANFALAVFQIFFKWDWSSAVATIKNGLELFPNSSSLYHALSTMYYISGDMESAIEAHSKGLEIDPLSLEMIFFMGIAYLWNREYEKALTYLEQVVEMVPNHRTAREYIGWTAAFQGNYKKALDIFKKLDPPTGYRLHRSTCLGWVYYKMNEKEKAEACKKEVLILENRSLSFTIDLMTLYTCFGDFDKAFHYLEKAILNKVGDSMMCRTDLFLTPLKDDGRFAAMEALVGEVKEFIP